MATKGIVTSNFSGGFNIISDYNGGYNGNSAFAGQTVDTHFSGTGGGLNGQNVNSSTETFDLFGGTSDYNPTGTGPTGTTSTPTGSNLTANLTSGTTNPTIGNLTSGTQNTSVTSGTVTPTSGNNPAALINGNPTTNPTPANPTNYASPYSNVTSSNQTGVQVTPTNSNPGGTPGSNGTLYSNSTPKMSGQGTGQPQPATVSTGTGTGTGTNITPNSAGGNANGSGGIVLSTGQNPNVENDYNKIQALLTNGKITESQVGNFSVTMNIPVLRLNENGEEVMCIIVLDELRKLGFTDKDITRLVNRELTYDALIDEITYSTDKTRLKLLMEATTLSEIKESFTDYEIKGYSLAEFQSQIDELETELNSYPSSGITAELATYELIRYMKEHNCDLEEAEKKMVLYYAGYDQLGNYHIYDNIGQDSSGWTNFGMAQSGMYQVHYGDIYKNSDAYKALEQRLKTQTIKRGIWPITWSEDILVLDTQDIDALMNSLESKIKNQPTPTEIRQKRTELQEEIQALQEVHDYLENEITYTLDNILAYTQKDDFSSFTYVNPSPEKYMDLLKEENVVNNDTSKYIQDKADVANLLSILINQTESANELQCGVYWTHNSQNNQSYFVNILCLDDVYNHYQTIYTSMTDQEIDIFNYIFNKEGAEAAYDYLERISKEIDNRWYVEKQKADAEWAKEHPVLASIYSVLATPFEGIAAAYSSVYAYFTNKPIFRCEVYSAGNVYRAAVSDAIRTGAYASEGNENAGYWSTLAFVYDTGMSMADTAAMIVTTVVTGGSGMLFNIALSAAMMGSRVYVSSLNDALDRGVSDGTAILYAFATASVETLMESYSLGHLMNLEEHLGKGAQAFIKAIGKKFDNPLITKGAYIVMCSVIQGLAEGEEELCTEIVDAFVDHVICRDLSNWNLSVQNYIADGETEEMAILHSFKDKAGDCFMAFLGGFASGMFFGGFKGVKNIKSVTKAQVEMYMSNKIMSELQGTSEFASLDKQGQAEMFADKLLELKEGADSVGEMKKLASKEYAGLTTQLIEFFDTASEYGMHPNYATNILLSTVTEINIGTEVSFAAKIESIRGAVESAQEQMKIIHALLEAQQQSSMSSIMTKTREGILALKSVLTTESTITISPTSALISQINSGEVSLSSLTGAQITELLNAEDITLSKEFRQTLETISSNNVTEIEKRVLSKLRPNMSQMDILRTLYYELGKLVDYSENFKYATKYNDLDVEHEIYDAKMKFSDLEKNNSIICVNWSQLFSQVLVDAGFSEDSFVIQRVVDEQGNYLRKSHSGLYVMLEDGSIVIPDLTAPIGKVDDTYNVKFGRPTEGFIVFTPEQINSIIHNGEGDTEIARVLQSMSEFDEDVARVFTIQNRNFAEEIHTNLSQDMQVFLNTVGKFLFAAECGDQNNAKIKMPDATKSGRLASESAFFGYLKETNASIVGVSDAKIQEYIKDISSMIRGFQEHELLAGEQGHLYSQLIEAGCIDGRFLNLENLANTNMINIFKYVKEQLKGYGLYRQSDFELSKLLNSGAVTEQQLADMKAKRAIGTNVEISPLQFTEGKTYVRIKAFNNDVITSDCVVAIIDNQATYVEVSQAFNEVLQVLGGELDLECRKVIQEILPTMTGSEIISYLNENMNPKYQEIFNSIISAAESDIANASQNDVILQSSVDAFKEIPTSDSEFKTKVLEIKAVTEETLPTGFASVEEYKQQFVRTLIETGQLNEISNPALFNIFDDEVMYRELIGTEKLAQFYERNFMVPACLQHLRSLSVADFNRLFSLENMQVRVSSLSIDELEQVLKVFSEYNHSSYTWITNEAFVNKITSLSVDDYFSVMQKLSNLYNMSDFVANLEDKSVYMKFLTESLDKHFTRDNILTNYNKRNDILDAFSGFRYENMEGISELSKRIINVKNETKQYLTDIISKCLPENYRSNYKIASSNKYYDLIYEIKGETVVKTVQPYTESIDVIGTLMNDQDVVDAVLNGNFQFKGVEFNTLKSALVLDSSNGVRAGINIVTYLIDGVEKRIVINSTIDSINLTYNYLDLFKSAKTFELIGVEALGSFDITENVSPDKVYLVTYESDGQQYQFYTSSETSYKGNIIFINGALAENPNLKDVTNLQIKEVSQEEQNNFQLDLSSRKAASEVFNDSEYGGNQSNANYLLKKLFAGESLTAIESEKAKLLSSIIDKYFPNASEMEKVNITEYYAQGGCAWMAITNAFATYMGSIENGHALFREKIGFDLTVTIDGKTSYNTEALALDMFLSSASSRFESISAVLKDKTGSGISQASFGSLIPPYFKERGIGFNVSFSSFFKNKSQLLSFLFNHQNSLNILLSENFDIELLSNNESNVPNMDRASNPKWNGRIREKVGGHAMMITGYQQGSLIVSSWLMKFRYIYESLAKYESNRVNIWALDFDATNNLGTNPNIVSESLSSPMAQEQMNASLFTRFFNSPSQAEIETAAKSVEKVISIMDYKKSQDNRYYAGLDAILKYINEGDTSAITRDGNCRSIIQSMDKQLVEKALKYIQQNQQQIQKPAPARPTQQVLTQDVINNVQRVIATLNDAARRDPRNHAPGLKAIAYYLEKNNPNYITRENNCRDYITSLPKEVLMSAYHYFTNQQNQQIRQAQEYQQRQAPVVDSVIVQNIETVLGILDEKARTNPENHMPGIMALQEYLKTGRATYITSTGNCRNYVKSLPMNILQNALDVIIARNGQQNNNNVNNYNKQTGANVARRTLSQINAQAVSNISQFSVLSRIEQAVNNAPSNNAIYSNLVRSNVRKILPTQQAVDYLLNRFSDASKYIINDQGEHFTHFRSRGFDLGNVKKRLYLNINNFNDTITFVTEFANKCEERGIPFYFKTAFMKNGATQIIESQLTREESIVIYSEDQYLPIYAEICNEIKNETGMSFLSPPMLTGVLDGFMGYGAEPNMRGFSYNSLRANLLENATNMALDEYMKSYNNGNATQVLAYIRNNQALYSEYLTKIYQNIVNLSQRYNIDPSRFFLNIGG